MPTYTEILETGLRALMKVGVPEPFAHQQMSLLIDAELCGHPSHGLLRLPRVIERIINGVSDPATQGEMSWKAESFLDVDGRQGLGPTVALAAIEHLLDRVNSTGIAIAAVRNCNHLGMLAWYAEHVASRGKVLLALTISEALVHPWGGRQALLGTNPIAVGVPAGPQPFVFDMATSVVSMGKIHDYANRGEAIPFGWALDERGDPTTDATAAKAGALAPFGGAKGYALGLAFEVLVASITACAVGRHVRGTLDSDRPTNKGDIFVVIEPAHGSGAAVSAFLKEVRTSRPADPERPVRIPGDRAREHKQVKARAGIQLPDELWRRIRQLAA